VALSSRASLALDAQTTAPASQFGQMATGGSASNTAPQKQATRTNRTYAARDLVSITIPDQSSVVSG
jgi:hypothetical protein